MRQNLLVAQEAVALIPGLEDKIKDLEFLLDARDSGEEAERLQKQLKEKDEYNLELAKQLEQSRDKIKDALNALNARTNEAMELETTSREQKKRIEQLEQVLFCGAHGCMY